MKKKGKLFTCELCGKTDTTVDIWCGGYLTYAHHKCAEIAHKALQLYLRYLLSDMYGLRTLAEEIVAINKQMTVRENGG